MTRIDAACSVWAKALTLKPLGFHEHRAGYDGTAVVFNETMGTPSRATTIPDKNLVRTRCRPSGALNAYTVRARRNRTASDHVEPGKVTAQSAAIQISQ
jgi:hypothetical protein